ncbi:MAG: tetratricopeptide repeat protein [Candidatus Adiutrix sp.]|nr:tetratricopeptide repeat protein [Candidatus Adiutrix sp.]
MVRSFARAVLAAVILAGSGCGGSLPPPDPPNLAEAKDSLSRGNYWFGRGCYREAGRFFREGEISARLSDEVRLIIKALNSQGAAALAQGDQDKAASFLAQALDLAQAQPGRPELDRILGNLAALARRLGRPEDAGELWRAAVQAAVSAGFSPATYQASLARLHLEAGRRDDFLALADQALAEALKSARPPAKTSRPPAGGAPKKGGGGSELSAETPTPAGPPAPENLVLADALNLAGQAAGLRGDRAAAEKFFREALALDRQMEYTPGLAQDTEALGALLSGGERAGEAAGFLDRAFHLRLALGDDQGAARILAALKDLSSGVPVNLEGYQAALKNPGPYRLDQRCP